MKNQNKTKAKKHKNKQNKKLTSRRLLIQEGGGGTIELAADLATDQLCDSQQVNSLPGPQFPPL